MTTRIRQRPALRRPSLDILGRSVTDRRVFETGWRGFDLAPLAGSGTRDPTLGDADATATYRCRSSGQQPIQLSDGRCCVVYAEMHGTLDYEVSSWGVMFSSDACRTWSSPTAMYELSDFATGSKWIGGLGIYCDPGGRVHMQFGKITGAGGAASDMTTWYRTCLLSDNPTLAAAGWDAEVEITSQVNPSDHPFFIPTGVMLRLKGGAFAGYLVQAGYFRAQGDTNAYGVLMYSDDDAATWASNAFDTSVINRGCVEPTICEVGNSGRIHMLSRINDTDGHLQAIITDPTTTLPDMTMMTTNGSTIVRGYNCMSTNWSDGNDIYAAYEVNNGVDLRGHLVVRRCTDALTNDDPTWPDANGTRTISHGWNGYCMGGRIRKGEYMLFFERDIDREWTAPGVPFQFLWHTRFSKKWLRSSLAQVPERIDLQLNEKTSGSLELHGCRIKDHGTHHIGISSKAAVGVTWSANGLEFAGTGLGVTVQPLQYANGELTGGPFDWRNDDITLSVRCSIHADMGGASVLGGILDGSAGGASDGYGLVTFEGIVFLVAGDPGSPVTYQVTPASVADGVDRTYVVQRNRATDKIKVWYDPAGDGVFVLGEGGEMADGQGSIINANKVVLGSYADGSNPFKGTISDLTMTRGCVEAPVSLAGRAKVSALALAGYAAPSFTLPDSYADCKLALSTFWDHGTGLGTDNFGGHNKGTFPWRAGQGVAAQRDLLADKLFRSGPTGGRMNHIQIDAVLNRSIRSNNGAAGVSAFYQRCSDATGSSATDTDFDFIQSTGVFSFAVCCRFLASTGTSQMLFTTRAQASGRGIAIIRLDADGSLTISISTAAGSIFNENFPTAIVPLDTPMMIVVEGLKSTTGKVKIHLATLPVDDVADFTTYTSTASIGTVAGDASTHPAILGGISDDNGGCNWKHKQALLFNTALSASYGMSEYVEWGQLAVSH